MTGQKSDPKGGLSAQHLCEQSWHCQTCGHMPVSCRLAAPSHCLGLGGCWYLPGCCLHHHSWAFEMQAGRLLLASGLRFPILSAVP